MVTLTDALALYTSSLKPLPAGTCALTDALGRVLVEPVLAGIDLPLFTQSAVDGYALHSADTVAATTGAPVVLTLVGEVPAGAPMGGTLAPGTAVRILTGGALPHGADTVVRQEHAERTDTGICLSSPLRSGVDTRFRGEELKRGELLAGPGDRLRAGLLAALAMAGVADVNVRRRPRIAVLVTGDEVAPRGTPLAPGQIYDANGPLVRAWLVERGYVEPAICYVPDDPATLTRSLATAIAGADLVITTGGVSVGDRDYLPEYAAKLGVRQIFWKVAQKPGKPLWFGTTDNCAVLGLPGNPAAVLVCLAVHVACVLGVLEGVVTPQPPWRVGILNNGTDADSRRDRLVRMSLRDDESGRAVLHTLPRQDSHMLSNLRHADALVWLPSRDRAYAAGEAVRWLSLFA